MVSGPRNRRLQVDTFTATQDAYGEPVETWSALATVWASYKPVSDGERYAAGEVKGVIDARFQILWRADLAALDGRFRLQFDGRIWDVIGVKEIGLREGLEISAAARSERL